MEPRKIAGNLSKPLIQKNKTCRTTGLESHREIRDKLWISFRDVGRGRLVHTLSALSPQAAVDKRRHPPDVHNPVLPPEPRPDWPGRRYPQHRCERYRACTGCAAGKPKMLRSRRPTATSDGGAGGARQAPNATSGRRGGECSSGFGLMSLQASSPKWCSLSSKAPGPIARAPGLNARARRPRTARLRTSSARFPASTSGLCNLINKAANHIAKVPSPVLEVR